jgi:hypothetical protein
MQSRAGIIVGLVIFLALATSPFWYGSLTGSGSRAPTLELPPGGEKTCVEEASYMREHHVKLLTTWRDSVVREGAATYRARSGKEYEISLTGTCLGCHSNKENFCDRCHNYLKVNPKCWDCHIVPERKR